jgi:raffinose/stachyose/melibiose transport system permease protein
VPLWWALPGIGFVVAFIYIAFVAGAGYAFTDWNGISAAARWIGIANFREIAKTPEARQALWHTLELTAAFVVVVNAVGLGLALALNRTVRSRNLLRALFFAPVVLSPLAVSYIWQYIFDVSGPLNGLLGTLGLHSWQRGWIGDPHWALWTIFVVMVWQFAGLAMTLYLAGLQSISTDLDEAAAVDGASTSYRLRRVTLPLLAPSFTISITLMTISGLRVFDQVKGLTGGGPGNASETLATQVYAQGFVNGRFGYSAAFGVVLTLLVALVSVTQVVVLRRREARL